MPEETAATENDRLARRVYIAFCCASLFFVVLIVLIGMLLVMD